MGIGGQQPDPEFLLPERAFGGGTGATLLLLPPYSPDLNPIEHDSAALKTLRKYHETASIDHIVMAYQ